VGGPLARLVDIEREEEIPKALELADTLNLPTFVLGFGSNILAADRGLKKLALRLETKGRRILEKDADFVRVSISAGEVLDDVVAWSVEQGLWGLENLSFVPGKVGALVVQNVGAYGAKADTLVESVMVFDMQDKKTKTLSAGDCKFDYRSSIFNTIERGRYIILSVILRLARTGQANMLYPDVEIFFAEHSVTRPKQADMRRAITAIRKRKGQDWNEHWSAGSFFKNLILTDAEFLALRERAVSAFGFARGDELDRLRAKFHEGDKIKIPLGYVLDKLLGMKGMSVGGAKLSEKQVINIVNTGMATAAGILELYGKVRTRVFEKLGVFVVHEPDFFGFTPEELSAVGASE